MVSKYLIDCLLASYKNGGNQRDSTSIHVSDLIEDFCPRKYLICVKENIPLRKREYLGVGLSLTYEMGKKIQSVVVGHYCKSGNLIGTWKCLVCRSTYFGFLKEKCPSCRASGLLRYVDTPLVLEDYGVLVVGHVDAMIVRPPKEIIVVEVKSIKPEGFDTLMEPIPANALQLSLYLWMLSKKAKHKDCNKLLVDNDELRGYRINVREGSVLYASKGFKHMPYKAFTVKPDKQRIASVEKDLDVLKNFSKSRRLPKRSCKSELSLLARTCHIRQLCFGKIK